MRVLAAWLRSLVGPAADRPWYRCRLCGNLQDLSGWCGNDPCRDRVFLIEPATEPALSAPCPGTGSLAPPTLSEMAECPDCGDRVQVISSRTPGRPTVRTLRWHLVAEQRVR